MGLGRLTIIVNPEDHVADHNVIAVSFSEPSKAFQALSDLNNAGQEGRVDVRSAAVVQRDERDRISVPEGGESVATNAPWGGSLIGLLIGVVGGPIGMLFGWTGGLLVGGALDVRRTERAGGVLAEVSTFIPTGGTAVVAEVKEATSEVVDALIADLGGVVHRRSAEDVLAHLEAAEEAYRQAEKEADRLVREERRSERRENAEERKSALREKLGLD